MSTNCRTQLIGIRTICPLPVATTDLTTVCGGVFTPKIPRCTQIIARVEAYAMEQILNIYKMEPHTLTDSQQGFPHCCSARISHRSGHRW
ncbi:hypothetical protein DMENIID0001_019120 [Sergentomyia squamirostris]